MSGKPGEGGHQHSQVHGLNLLTPTQMRCCSLIAGSALDGPTRWDPWRAEPQSYKTLEPAAHGRQRLF